MTTWALLILASFLSGSVPFGLLIARAKGVDIRRHGSKNIGATNVARVLGWKPGLLCFALDVLKGFAPTFIAGRITGASSMFPLEARAMWLWLAVMAAAVLGHMFSPWVAFKGGKGVATSLGAMLGVFPHLAVPALGALAVWIATVGLTRYVGLASCAAAAALPGLVWLWGFIAGRTVDAARLAAASAAEAAAHHAGRIPLYIVTGLLAALVIYKHRANLARAWAGTENKLGARVPASPDKQAPREP